VLFSPVYAESDPRLLSLAEPSARSQSRLGPFLRALALPHAALPLCARTLAPANPVQSCIYFTTPCIPGGVPPPSAFSRLPRAVSAKGRSFTQSDSREGPLSPLESAHPRPLTCKPCRMNTSKTSQICIKTKDFNPIRMNTSKTSRRVLKTKGFKSTGMNTSAIWDRNPFRIRTSKKKGGRGSRGRQERDGEMNSPLQRLGGPGPSFLWVN